MSRLDNYSLLDYGWMINSRERTDPWVEALRAAVKPGSVVLDIGTGTGLFAFLACRFGASRVYALEPGDAIEVARLCARDNPLSERIRWIKSFSTAIDLPERVDVVIGDLHGNLPFHTANITSLVDARKRHLKPGGRMIPVRDLLYAAPAEWADGYEGISAPWQSNPYGVDFSAGRRFVANANSRLKADAIPQSAYLANPASWGEVDYRSAEGANLSGSLDFTVTRAGRMHGYFVWFDGELGEGLGFSNAPHRKLLPYGRTFFPLFEPLDLQAGDRVDLNISANLVEDEFIYRWHTRVTTGGKVVEFRQSSLDDRLPNIEELRRGAAGHVPSLSEEGKVDLEILGYLQQSRPIGEIAERMQALYPQRFAHPRAALSHVARLSVKYSA